MDLKLSELRFYFEIKILNSDESHFSTEENGLLLYGCLTLFSFTSIFYNIKKCVQFSKKEDSKDWALIIIIIALGLSCLQFLM